MLSHLRLSLITSSCVIQVCFLQGSLLVFLPCHSVYCPQSHRYITCVWKLKHKGVLNCGLQHSNTASGGRSSNPASFSSSEHLLWRLQMWLLDNFLTCFLQWWIYLSEQPLHIRLNNWLLTADRMYTSYTVIFTPQRGKQLDSEDWAPHCLMIFWWCFMKFLADRYFKSALRETAFMGHCTKTRPLSVGQIVGQCQPMRYGHKQTALPCCEGNVLRLINSGDQLPQGILKKYGFLRRERKIDISFWVKELFSSLYISLLIVIRVNTCTPWSIIPFFRNLCVAASSFLWSLGRKSESTA